MIVTCCEKIVNSEKIIRSLDWMDVMKGFIDIHTHILPGVDDGAGDQIQALNMVRQAYEDGTRTMILTPHYRGRFKANDLQKRFDWFSELVSREMPEMKLYLGSEVCYEQAVPEALAAKQALSINGSPYCLLEFLPGSFVSQVLTGVWETVRYGYIPIIAHLERYEIFRKDPNLIDQVLDMGALLQLNADSVLGKRGWGVARFCKRLLKQRKVHFIASDAHDVKKRPPLLGDCWQRVCRLCGREYATALFYGNAKQIISEEDKGENHG